MQEADPLRKYYEGNVPRSVYRGIAREFKEKVAGYFNFLRKDYGFTSNIKGESSGITYELESDNLDVSINLDKYLVEAHLHVKGKAELKLAREQHYTAFPFLTIEDCLNPEFEYKRATWGEPGYVDEELKLFSSILIKYSSELIENDPHSFVARVSDCIMSRNK